MKTSIVCFVSALAAWSAPALCQDKFQAKIDPTTAQRLQEARKLRVAGELDTSIVQLKELVVRNPNYYAANYNLGLALTDAKRPNEGIHFLERARSIREADKIPDATIYNSLGWAYMVDGRFTDAESAFQLAQRNQGLLSTESKTRRYNNWGWLYLSTGRTDLAKRKFQVAEREFGSDYATKNIKAIEQSKKP